MLSVKIMQRLGLLLAGSAVVALLAVACGEDATATPLPTSTPTATAAPPTPTATPIPTPTPSFVTAKEPRLVVSTGVPIHEAYLPWRSSSQLFLQRPMYESVISTDPVSGAYAAQLAADWDISPDAKKWTLNLREGIQFHKDWGEFTAKDVVHAWTMIVTEGGSVATDVGQWTALVSEAGQFETPDDHTIVFNLNNPEPDLDFRLSTRSGNMLITSVDHFDALGSDAMEEDPAGTSAYRFVERQIGQSVLYERVEDHWRLTPEFRELMIRIVREEATRLAMLLSGEAHISDIPTDLRREAVSQGMKSITSPFFGTNFFYFFGGLYPGDPETFNAEFPWTDKRVREAMNRAVNRQELIETIFDGNGFSIPLMYHSPAELGWDPSWEDRMETEYGYDPGRARELLTEAGYSDGFTFKLYNYNIATFSEGVQVGEALAGYFEDVGLDVDLVDIEYNIPRGKLIDKQLDGLMYWWPFAARPPTVGLGSTWTCPGTFAVYCHEDTEKLYAQMIASSDPQERADLARQIGEHQFSEYAALWMFHVNPSVVVDPDVVGDYPFPGNWTDLYTHLEFVEGVK